MLRLVVSDEHLFHCRPFTYGTLHKEGTNLSDQVLTKGRTEGLQFTVKTPDVCKLLALKFKDQVNQIHRVHYLSELHEGSDLYT